MTVEKRSRSHSAVDEGTRVEPGWRKTGGDESAVAGPAVLPSWVVGLFAVAAGLSVANVYFAHPLLDAIAREFKLRHASVGMVFAATQSGYALGLLLLVPLGDLLDRRRLIIGQLLLSVVALLMVALAPNIQVLLMSMVLVGLLAVVVQTLVAFAASLATPAERGGVVGTVTSGVVIGILLARVVAGLLADLASWRAVYLCSAAATLVIAGVLFRILPNHAPAECRPSYPQLLRSVFALFVQEPLLRIRAGLALLIFAAFSTFWTSLGLVLSAPPFSMSPTGIGMFGLAGLAGALGASRTGRLVDRGWAHWTTGLGLSLLLASWLPISFAPSSLATLVVGVILLDLAIQAVHVTNQSLLFTVRPEAQSRLVAGYMVFYSLGSGLGSIASTTAFAHTGWTGVCVVGGSFSALALFFWAFTVRASARTPDAIEGSSLTCNSLKYS